MLAGTLSMFPQADNRTVVGVSEFSCQESSPYTGLVTEKVIEMLTNSKRFRVVDRTSRDKIEQELDLQRHEAFMESENLVDQNSAMAAEKLINGHIVKIPVYKMKNNDGSVRGYKASVGMEMKMVDVATGLSSEATSFQGKASKECLSPEAAVKMAMDDMQDDIFEWFRVTFPLTCKVSRALNNEVTINAGSNQGINKGDVLTVELIETIDGMPFHQDLGEIKVAKVAGPYFSQCTAPKKLYEEIAAALANNNNLQCTLKIKK